MIEVIVVLMIMFAAYITSLGVKEVRETPLTKKPAPPVTALATPTLSAVVSNTPKSTPKPKSIKPTPIKATPQKATKIAPAKNAAAPESAPINLTNVSFKNPANGEIATPYRNYRFTKRWIKDALVTEGLLDKVYKNNELDDAVEAKIKVAITQLEGMEKYRA